MAGSSYINLPKELDHPWKDLINIKNMNDNVSLKWCIFRYLNQADHHPARIRKIGEILAAELDFEDIKFPVKVKDIRKIEKKNSIEISGFSFENKKKHPIYISKNVKKTDQWIYY